MVAACAAGAVIAPVAGAAPSAYNTHDIGADPSTLSVTYTDDSAAGATLGLGLSTDGSGDLVFDASTVTTPVLGLDNTTQTNDCFAPGTDAVQCPAQPTRITLGTGPDTVQLGDGLPSLTVDGNVGADNALDLHTRNAPSAINLRGTPDMAAAPSGMNFGNFQQVTGGAGGDTFTVAADAPAVAINGGTGVDRFVLPDGAPSVTLDGGAGSDSLDYSQRTAGVSVDFAADADGLTASGIESVTGSGFGDTITGDDAGEQMSGAGGADSLSGGSGIDTLSGDAGDDTVNGGGGSDTLNGNDGGDAVNGNIGDDTIDGGAGNDTLSGNEGNDTLDGNTGDDTLTGGDGNDTLDGGAGTNTLRGGNGDDTLTGSGADDTLIGGPGIDNYVGGTGDDQIVAIDGVRDNITCAPGKTDTVFADLGADGIVDNITNPTDCLKITGTVATKTTTTVTETLQPVIVVPSNPTGPVPVLAPGTASFADLTPPSASMRSFTRQRLATVANRGVPMRVTCKEACGISVAITIDRATARRLKLDSRVSPVVIATASAQRRAAGTTQLRVKFTKKAAAALKKSRRGVVATTQVLVSDASGNGTLLSRHVTFVR